MKTKLIFLIILIVSISVFLTSCSNQDDIKKEEDVIIDLMGGPDPEEYQNFLKLGNYYYALGNLKKAQDYYRKAVKVEPNSYEAHFNLALVHEVTFNFVLAKKEYRAAIRIKPESIKAHLNLGLVIYKDDTDKYEDALHEFFWVLEQEP
ncbi:tetratricopeptide repeat protein, partial [Candidatus Dependentiae bacterium]|nr:tetratricopeptide repeat protein [Candidatus Dependentiae bacterium]